MAKSSVSLLVCVPESSRQVGAGQKFTILIYVDPPNANLDVCVHLHPGNTNSKCVVSDIEIPPYNKVVWIDNLPAGFDHTLCVQANADGYAPSCHRGKIRRDTPQKSNAKAIKSPQGVNPPSLPIICYPPQNGTVPPNFPSYGYVTPFSDPVSVWIVDGNGNVYPGGAMNPPPQPYDWSAGFQNIPVGSYTLYAKDTISGATASISITVAVP